ncbi:CMGC/CDK/CCRK protein kinase [Salpingoeca rosetta]|uniref:cyclin-dependent kinase n=1 Tax=Salpingoeca rosetta (strain ATCC 50818 / BSB-021) TaxID=946362 RepID=F2TY67_SALR5|nr:CMGC/CDK/CCRK protein kinase [Salpingoeca rosetta]EGD76326.1 CMGC/CDK/CCRK protein kinase [Salpingoeca rosetta]|eukprot:XP_004998501.1 CMGC/CDK/CCRK protein kinase [Salpingoeca rosetta]
MDNYRIERRVGEGAHGVVFLGVHLASGQRVALKKVTLARLDDGIPTQVIREIRALCQLTHKNVVTLHDVFPSGMGIMLCFEYMASDLARVLQGQNLPLSAPHVKRYMSMLLSGVDFCHSHAIVHRDLKPANLLISATGQLKIADFGLARVYDEARPMSHQVATRWYRAPELLYGARVYDFGVDIWAVGCIFGELLNNSPLFPGENDIDQLSCVIQALGTPTRQDWPELDSLPDFAKINFDPTDPQPMHEILPDATQDAINLCSQFLVYSSSRRLPAAKALVHPYFFSYPLPAHHSELKLPTSSQPESMRLRLVSDLPFVTFEDDDDDEL